MSNGTEDHPETLEEIRRCALLELAELCPSEMRAQGKTVGGVFEEGEQLFEDTRGGTRVSRTATFHAVTEELPPGWEDDGPPVNVLIETDGATWRISSFANEKGLATLLLTEAC